MEVVNLTVNIGYASKCLSIIVTDRRINYGKNQEFGYSDNNNKLVNLKDMGWATGAGLASFWIVLKRDYQKVLLKIPMMLYHCFMML